MSCPTIVCLCGSLKFLDVFASVQLSETLDGNIVLTIGSCDYNDDEIFEQMKLSESEREKMKARLDILHLRKIDLADEILVLNVGGYVGYSTRREIEYAMSKGKRIRYFESKSLR